METRRIRRLERRRTHRIVVLVMSFTLAGLAVGTALPRNATATIALGSLAACGLVVVVLRREAVAPLHGLHHVVRLHPAATIGAAAASYGARIVGSAHAVAGRLRPPTAPDWPRSTEDVL